MQIGFIAISVDLHNLLNHLTSTRKPDASFSLKLNGEENDHLPKQDWTKVFSRNTDLELSVWSFFQFFLIGCSTISTSFYIFPNNPSQNRENTENDCTVVFLMQKTVEISPIVSTLNKLS